MLNSSNLQYRAPIITNRLVWQHLIGHNVHEKLKKKKTHFTAIMSTIKAIVMHASFIRQAIFFLHNNSIYAQTLHLYRALQSVVCMCECV